MNKRNLTVKQHARMLWAAGYNPIHLFGNVYLVRHKSCICSKIPFYKIRILREVPLDKIEYM